MCVIHKYTRVLFEGQQTDRYLYEHVSRVHQVTPKGMWNGHLQSHASAQVRTGPDSPPFPRRWPTGRRCTRRRGHRSRSSASAAPRPCSKTTRSPHIHSSGYVRWQQLSRHRCSSVWAGQALVSCGARVEVLQLTCSSSNSLPRKRRIAAWIRSLLMGTVLPCHVIWTRV